MSSSGSARPPALELKGLEMRYGRSLFRPAKSVLRGVSLSVPAGASIGLIGPNGSGKSTVLRIAAGAQRATKGGVLIFGRSLEEKSARARLGFLSDGSPFPPELSARSVLRLLAALHRLERGARNRRCEDLLERTGLAAEAQRPLGSFSRGMLRRFGLAQAFLHTPDVILLDEPTAGLDAPGYGVLEDFLGEAARRGASLLLASHNPTDLTSFTGHVFVLLDGRITRQGSPQELLPNGRGMAELYCSRPAKGSP